MATVPRVKHSKFDHVAINQGLTVVYPDPDQPKKSPGDDIAVDIVAVPGLGASPDFTWRTNKVDWLRDSNMLPRSITNARIMVFEYESQWFGKGAIDQRLSSVADQLVQALFLARSRSSKRPIVFVCHCLGGIIAEKAILTAQLRQNDYPNLFMSVVGCIFLGTPFRGTKSQSKASLLADMAQTLGLGVNSGLLKLLEPGSETLRNLLSDFSSLARQVNLQVFCFFEQHESDVMNLAIKNSHIKHKEIIVEEDSAHIDGYRTGALAADHFGLNKFTGPKDGRYVLVSGEINATVQKAGGILKSRQNAMRQSLIDDATYQTILDDLKSTDPLKDLQDSVRGRPASQASWALTNENYVKWKDASASHVLWIHGSAGKGQPVIASSLINDMDQQSKNQDGVFLAYFFCDEKDARRRKVRDVLKLLIRQMILKRRDLTEYLLVDDEKGQSGNRKSQNFDTVPLPELWRRLQSMLGDPMVDRVYFVINAFDETDRESRKDFLELLAPYLEAAVANVTDEAPVKWLFLSRSGRPDVEKSLRRALIIRIEDKENAGFVNDGVKREISGQVDELAKLQNFNDALTYLVKRFVYAKADGNYIYTSLVVQELKNLEPRQLNVSTIRRLLEDLPYGLTDMFEFIRRRVLNPLNEDIEYTKEILRCLVLSLESPTLAELAMMADLPSEMRNDEAILRRLIRRCGAFITVSEDEGNEVVEWIDVAAKEHLNTYAKDELSLTLNDVQHGIIALRCLEHVRSVFAVEFTEPDNATVNSDRDIMVPDATHEKREPELFRYEDEPGLGGEPDTGVTQIEKITLQDQESHEGDRDDDLESQDTSHNGSKVGQDAPEPYQDPESPLEYAVQHWIEHAMLAPGDIVEEFDLNDEFWCQDSLALAAWWDSYSKESRFAGVSAITSLHLAASIGYPALLEYLLENGRKDEIQRADSWGYSPLAWACDQGDISLVVRLLKAGADVNMTATPSGPTVLWAASFSGHIEVVEHLLEQGAEVDSENEGRGSPLYVAVSGCSPEIVRELINHDADVNLKGGLHIRPLNVAAYSGYKDIMEVLLEHEVAVDPDDDYRYGNALGAAARRGHSEIVSALLKKGWNVNRKLKAYDSPLVAAATYGHTDVVQVLLQYEVEGSSKVQALDVASKNGRTEIVKVLLAQTPYLPHQKAFHNAAMCGRDDILEMLQARGTNPDLLNLALYDASDQERESTVNLLLEFGADPDAEGKEYGTALQAASFDGSRGIVESLIASKADVNKEGGDYGTALQAGASSGHIEICQILLDHGALVNIGVSGRYGSALQGACWSGNVALVELLIARGADVISSGGIYGSPIMAAVDESMNQTLDILVSHGADVNVKDVRDEKPTLLVQAGYTLGKESLELLLDHGADIDGTDDDGVTVLISVADSGDKDSLAMLIERGANIHALSKSLGTALSAAASEGDEECCRFLLDNGANVNQESGDWGTALMAASEAGDLDCINMLLEANADVNQDGGPCGSALQSACNSGNVDCVNRLISVGANVNQTGGELGCPLQAAAYGGHRECLLALIEHDVDINLEGGTYHCSLQASAARHDNYECVRTLLDHGANTLSYGGLLHSVMQAAAMGQNIDLFDILLEHGADIHASGGKYGNALQAASLMSNIDFVQQLLAYGVDVNDVGGKYWTALQSASFGNNTAIVVMLLGHNVNPQLEGGFYGNALKACVARGNTDTLIILLEQALPVEMLDEALIQAVYRRQESAVEMLLKKGASAEAWDDELGSAYDALQKAAPEDVNSDDEGDDDDDEDQDSDSDEGSEGEEDGEGEDGSDTDDASSQGDTNNQESVVDVPIDDSVTTESKIRKLLDDARAKIRRNPTLRRPPTVKRKPLSQHHETSQVSDISGLAQSSIPLSGGYQTLSEHWRVSQPQETNPDQAGTHRPAITTASSNSEYVPYSNRSQINRTHASYERTTYQDDSNVQNASGDPSRISGVPPQAQSQYVNRVQQPPPLPPKADISSYSEQSSSAQHPPILPYQDPYASAGQPPPQPPRPIANNSNYQAYTSNTQFSPYRPQQPYQAQQSPYGSSGPPPTSNYTPYVSTTQSPPTATSNANPPPFPPRPPPSTGQNTDSLDLARLQEKANKFGASMGKFWK